MQTEIGKIQQQIQDAAEGGGGLALEEEDRQLWREASPGAASLPVLRSFLLGVKIRISCQSFKNHLLQEV